MASLDIDARRRSYYEHYPAGSTTVVLVHGWGMGCDIGRQAAALLPRLRDSLSIPPQPA